MKRFISLVLTLLIFVMYTNMVVCAGTLTEITLSAVNDIYNKVAGEGYYDNESAGGTRGFETQDVSVILRRGEWICYDISTLAKGTYEVSFYYGAINTPLSVSVSVDNEERLSQIALQPTPEYTAHTNCTLGIINLSGNQEKLKITNSSPTAAMYVKEITLKKVEPLEFVSCTPNTSNADVENGFVARGADVFTVTMSEDVKPLTVTNQTVMIKTIKDSAEYQLSSSVSSTGRVITIKLKESLDYSEVYTLYIDGVMAERGVGLDAPVVKTFNTADETEKKGSASIEVTSYEAMEGTITVEGYIKSSAGFGISGRNAELYTKHEDAGEKSLAATVTSGDDGVFTITYSLPNNAECGKYEVVVTSDYVENAYTESMLYFTSQLEEEIKGAFSGLSSITSVESAVNTYLDYIDVDMEWAENVIPDFDSVYEHMLDKEFETSTTAINAVGEAIYFEAIVQTDDKDIIVGILGDESKNKYITGFNEELWNVLDEKGLVAEKAIDMTPDNMVTLAKDLNTEIETQLISQYGIAASNISFTFDEVITGEIAEITATLEQSISDVSGMHFKFAYNENSARIFESGEISIDVPAGIEYEIKVDDEFLVVDITAASTTDISGEFMTLHIPTFGNTVGRHTSSVSGYILYSPGEIKALGKDLTVTFAVAQNPVIDVKAVESMEISALDVINRIEGEGFHDETSLGGTPGLDVSGNRVIYRAGEWGVYNVSSLAEGRYKVSVIFSNSAAATFAVNIDEKTISKDMGTSGGYTTYITADIGIIEVSGLQQTLKFLNKGSGAAYVETILFERVNNPEIVELTTNAGISGTLIPRGADRFNITYNNVLNVDSITDSTVTIIDEDGMVMPLRVFASDKTIIIDLKETLDFNKEYTIKIKGVTDKYVQDVSGEIVLRTDNTINTSGMSSININTWKVNGKVFTVEGKILSSSGIGIKGREIKLSAKAPNGTAYEVWADGKSGDDGQFSLKYTFDDGASSGKYALNVDYEYAENSYLNNAYYFDDELSGTIADEFSNLQSGDEVLAKLIEYAEQTGINPNEMTDVDISYITNNMTGKEYDSAGAVIDEVNKRYILEKINQADNADDVKTLIDNEYTLKEIAEIQRDKWNVLSEAEQTQIATDIYNGDRMEEPIFLIEKIDELINGLLKEKYNIQPATISANSSTVNVGQSASITLTSTSKQEKVVGVCIEIKYENSSAALFKNVISYTLSKDLKNLLIDKTVVDGKTTFKLSVPRNTEGIVSKVFFRDEIIKIDFLCADGTAGKHIPNISGYITYLSDEAPQSAEYFVDVPFEIVNNPEIVVNALNGGGKNEYSGGGGAAGGGSYKPEEFKPQIPDEEIKPVSAFSDLNSVPWAKESIEALALKGIINGRGNGIFAPNDSVTRAEFCKMIVLAFGLVDEKAVCVFDDVERNTWYYTYIASAKAAGIINGKENNKFSPDATITREEMAAIAQRAISKDVKDVTEKFADDSAISDYAKDAVYTLKELGIINGVGENMFSPKAVVTRAMAAKVIYMLSAV